MTGVLKALTAPGVWTPVGGLPLDPVFVGPDQPGDEYSLWFDTDEVAEDVLTRAEVLDMLPTEHNAGGIGATTSGTTSLTVCTLNVPARPLSGTITVRGLVRIQKSVLDDIFLVRVLADGLLLSERQSYQGSTFEWFTLTGFTTVAANTAVVLTTVIARIGSSTGTATTIAAIAQNNLQATYTPIVT